MKVYVVEVETRTDMAVDPAPHIESIFASRADAEQHVIARARAVWAASKNDGPMPEPMGRAFDNWKEAVEDRWVGGCWDVFGTIREFEVHATAPAAPEPHEAPAPQP